MDVIGSYRDDGYALVRELIPPEVAQALLARIQTDIEAQGRTFDSFAQRHALVSKSSVEISGHYHPPLLTFLWGLTPLVAQLTGRELLPSYDYFRIYSQGDICRLHSDRPSCEHSMSLTLGLGDGVEWPFDIGSRPVDGPDHLKEDFGDEPYASLAMRPGDAALYQGVRFRHGRVTPNPNRWSAHLFLHWVDRDGPHKDHAFDARRVAEHR